MIIENTDPLDRVNYFNGQRLEADDFRLEQDYHMRVRRLLNSSLFTYGIAGGLEVKVKPGDPHRVVVSPGLALDVKGREIVLLEETELLVTGLPSLVEGVALGNYLTIRYSEVPAHHYQDGCQVATPGSDSQRLAWGGPTRLRAGATLEWQRSWPDEPSGLIVLAQAELGPTCDVRDLRASVRRYVMTAPSRTLTYALEGEKDIDSENPKQIYFHIRGGRPAAVTLYLRGAEFSDLYYTQMGIHSHSLDVELPVHTGLGNHTHPLEQLTILSGGSHVHGIEADVNQEDHALETSNLDNSSFTSVDLIRRVNMRVDGGDHSHTISGGEKAERSDDMDDLVHNFTAAEVGETGVGPSARTSPEKAYTFPANLEVSIDDVSYTTEILNRLTWLELGDGTSIHNFVETGTGPIQVDLLGVDLFPGEHCIELSLPSGGGRVLYNLYVE